MLPRIRHIGRDALIVTRRLVIGVLLVLIVRESLLDRWLLE
jgi:hypothetical protein